MGLSRGSVTGGFKHFEREVGGDGKLLKSEGKPVWYNWNFTLGVHRYGNKGRIWRNKAKHCRITEKIDEGKEWLCIFCFTLISQDSTLAPGKHSSALGSKHILIMFTRIKPQGGNPFGNIVCSNSDRICAVFYLRSNGLIWNIHIALDSHLPKLMFSSHLFTK